MEKVPDIHVDAPLTDMVIRCIPFNCCSGCVCEGHVFEECSEEEPWWTG